MKKTIVGICACPVGIAHTYMAAEALENAIAELGYNFKIETQGSSGTENSLTAKDLSNAELIIKATSVKISGSDRLEDHQDKILEISLKDAIRNAKNLISQALNL
ncbi:MAG: PTS fructose transporter subunit IIB [Cetobacterium sp.]